MHLRSACRIEKWGAPSPVLKEVVCIMSIESCILYSGRGGGACASHAGRWLSRL